MNLPPPLFIIDASVIAHQIGHKLQQYGLNEQEEHMYCMMAFHWIQQCGFSNTYRHTVAPVVWAMDSPPYWRKQVLPEYKANRKPRTPIVKRVKNLLKATELPKLAFPTYEADDVASLLVRLFITRQLSGVPGIRLLSVDSDWSGMCGPDTHFWESQGRSPVVRTPDEVYGWLQTKWGKQAKKWQRAWALPERDSFYCDAVWKWKTKVGDKADNIAPDSDPGLIDLFKPVKEFDLFKQPEAARTAKECVVDAKGWQPLATVKELESEILGLGMDMPMGYIEGW